MSTGESRATPWQDRRGAAAGHLEVGGLELSHLGRYVVIAALVAGCMMLSAWSRIDLRGTAVGLDQATRAWHSARADQARLELELAALKSPANLRLQADGLGLSEQVDLVTVQGPKR